MTPASPEAGVSVVAMILFVLRQVTWLMLVPWLCGAAKLALGRVAAADNSIPEVSALMSGAAVAAIGFRLFRPQWVVYVAGHELTHALWALLFGKRVTAIKVRESGGHVVLSGTNSIITLAPYFFPFYGVIWLLVAACLNGWSPLRVPAWVVAFGFGGTYMVHLLMTAKVLRFRQPDIESEGYMFSAVLVVLGNLVTGLVLCPLSLGTLRMDEMAAAVWHNAGWCIDRLAMMAGELARQAGVL